MTGKTVMNDLSGLPVSSAPIIAAPKTYKNCKPIIPRFPFDKTFENNSAEDFHPNEGTGNTNPNNVIPIIKKPTTTTTQSSCKKFRFEDVSEISTVDESSGVSVVCVASWLVKILSLITFISFYEQHKSIEAKMIKVRGLNT